MYKDCHDCPYFSADWFFGSIVHNCNEGSVYFGNSRFADKGVPELCPLKKKEEMKYEQPERLVP